MLISTLSVLAFLSLATGAGDLPKTPVLASIHLAYESHLEPPEPIFVFNILPDADPISSFGAEGSTRWMLQGAAAIQNRHNSFVGAGFGFEHFIENNLSLITQFNGMYFEQKGQDAEGANFVFLMRWHYLARESWSAFFETGIGVLWSSNDVPAAGSSLNFTPQAAFGVTFDIGENTRANVALGWHHISNANTYNDNPGRDSFILHMGLSFPF